MTPKETRSTERILLGIPIRVLGLKCSSGEFIEDTRTVVVNRAGARIALRHRVTPGDTLRIINLHNYDKADFRVVVPASPTDQPVMEWGVECLDRSRNIWGIEFGHPLVDRSGALIQCQTCHLEVFTALSQAALEDLGSTGTLQRPCGQCARLTTWSYALVTREPQQPPPKQGEAVATPIRLPETSKGRINDRHGAKMQILVRSPQGQEEISVTENVSTGGLAVSLAMDANVGDELRVIYPYSGEGQKAEQKAEVRRRATYAFAGRRLYGLRILN